MLENRNLVKNSLNLQKMNATMKKPLRYFFTKDERIILLGQYQNEMVYWFSIGSVFYAQLDELVSEAFEADCKEMVSLQQVLSETGYSFQDLLYTYSDVIKEKMEAYHLLEEYKGLKEKANQVDIETQRRLYDYLIRSFNRSGDPASDLNSFKLIIQQVKEMKYILLTDDETLRLTFVELKKSCNELLEAYRKNIRR